MKQIHRIGLFITVLLFSSCGLLLAQTTHTIVLQVNTAALNGPDASAQSVFVGQPENSDSKDYTIYVDPGDTIVWQAQSSSNPGVHGVLVRTINHQGGDNVFGQNVLRDTEENPGIVQGVVIEGTRGFEQKYMLMFQVSGDGRPGNRVYQIDPKIRVRDAE